MNDLTIFQYITDIPANITNEVWFEFAVRCYNLGLTMSWFIIFQFLYNVTFTCFSKLYKKGHD